MRLLFLGKMAPILGLVVIASACSHTEQKESSRAQSGEQQNLSLQEEYQLGTKVGSLVLGNYAPLESQFNRYATTMARYLAMYSTRPVLFKGYRASLIDCSDLAAISTPGGFVFLSKPLVEATTNEDELAGVIAHEVAHIALRHGEMSIRRKAAAQKSRKETESLLDDVTDLADFFVPASSDKDAEKTLEQVKRDRETYGKHVSDLSEVMKVYKHNSNQEYAADKMALEILLDAGYDPQKYANFLARNFSTADRIKNTKKTPIKMFETHPLDEDRVKRIRAAIKGWRPGPNSRSRDTRFAKYRALAAKAS
jgi:predicted Zn-dependent protease